MKEINSSKKNNIIRGVRGGGGWMHGPPGRRGLFNITSKDLLKKTPRILDFGGSTLKKSFCEGIESLSQTMIF